LQIPEYELADAPALQPSSTPVDQSKIDEAVAIWRSSELGKGDGEFWMLGVRLRDLGMAPYEIESLLKQEAGKNPRSKQDRKRQIPSIVKNLFSRTKKAFA
jgi:hypothetical protein